VVAFKWYQFFIHKKNSFSLFLRVFCLFFFGLAFHLAAHLIPLEHLIGAECATRALSGCLDVLLTLLLKVRGQTRGVVVELNLHLAATEGVVLQLRGLCDQRTAEVAPKADGELLEEVALANHTVNGLAWKTTLIRVLTVVKDIDLHPVEPVVGVNLLDTQSLLLSTSSPVDDGRAVIEESPAPLGAEGGYVVERPDGYEELVGRIGGRALVEQRSRNLVARRVNLRPDYLVQQQVSVGLIPLRLEHVLALPPCGRQLEGGERVKDTARGVHLAWCLVSGSLR
jgi:hypothetical protein